MKNHPNFPARWQGLVGLLQDITVAHYKGRLCTLAVYGSVRVWRGNAWYWDLKPGHAFGETIHLI